MLSSNNAFSYLANLPGAQPLKAYQQQKNVGSPTQEVQRFENQVLGGLVTGNSAQVGGSNAGAVPDPRTPGIQTVQQVVQGTGQAVRNSSQRMLADAQMARAVKVRKAKEEAERQRQMQIMIQRVGGPASGAPGGGGGMLANYGAPAGGTAVARIQSILGRFPGLHITETLGNRAYDVAHGVARVPTSYHYDAANPAVDIAGPINQLWALYYEIQRMGGWRQILWQVEGHYDHLHVA